ncbi:DMT family transporter [Porticoccus hydrocarbonoclasticus]|uniref:DMT family transporter n=1 Tax=Porticoccus hydrocarbonoclasticus TaxID=1073414 RepID=UPI0005674D0B|nr:DMT family transporter [Porticoccus hydrocarbonoclasticus]
MHPNLRAILYLQLCLMFFLVGDSVAKRLLETIPLGQMICLRTAASLLVLTAFILATGRLRTLRVSKPVHQLLRSLFFTVISLGYYVAIKHFPISAVSAATAGAPILISAISPLILKERANAIQWLATITGFIGVCLVLKPDVSNSGWHYLALTVLPLAFAIMILWSRYLSRTESDWSMNYYIYIPLLLAAFFWQQEAWIALDNKTLLMVLVSGSGGAFGFIMMVAAYRVGKPVIVAPFQYTAIIMALGVDIIFWQFYPNLGLWIGIGLILLCAGIQGWQARIEEPAITPHLRPEDTHTP